MAEYDNSGQLARKYVFGPGINKPVLMQAGKTKHDHHSDHLGSIIALADNGRLS